MTAPVAFGRSDRRVEFAPTDERRLSTAHTENRHCDKTSACGADRGMLLAQELTAEQAFPSADQPDKGPHRHLPYRFKAGVAWRRQPCYGCQQLAELIWGIPVKYLRVQVGGVTDDKPSHTA